MCGKVSFRCCKPGFVCVLEKYFNVTQPYFWGGIVLLLDYFRLNPVFLDFSFACIPVLNFYNHYLLMLVFSNAHCPLQQGLKVSFKSLFS